MKLAKTPLFVFVSMLAGIGTGCSMYGPKAVIPDNGNYYYLEIKMCDAGPLNDSFIPICKEEILEDPMSVVEDHYECMNGKQIKYYDKPIRDYLLGEYAKRHKDGITNGYDTPQNGIIYGEAILSTVLHKCTTGGGVTTSSGMSTTTKSCWNEDYTGPGLVVLALAKCE